MAAGSPTGFFGVDPANYPITILNHVINWGWEYVWHCHLLGHEENDMMRGMIIGVPPATPTGLAGSYLTGPSRAHLTWTDTGLNATNYTIDRATNSTFTAGLVTFVAPRVPGSAQSYDDTTVPGGGTIYYRLRGSNIVGDTTNYGAAPIVGFQSMKLDSGYTGFVSVTAALVPPSNLRVTQVTGNSISLAWTRGQTTGFTGFQIQRSLNGTTNWTVVGTVGANTTTFTNTGLLSRTRYYYRVRAYLTVGGNTTYSGFSNTVNGLTGN
jgi:hypothetical protein